MQLHRNGLQLKGLQVSLAAVIVIALAVLFLPVSSFAADAETGKKYFTGELQFENGGPACISCHNAGNVGSYGGGSLGPDLTSGKSMFIATSWLNSDGTPVMGPIFSKRNITETEAASLKAFLSSTDGQTPANTGKGKFLITGIIGTIVMLIIFSIVWSGRYRKRCEGGTAHDALWRNYGGKGGR